MSSYHDIDTKKLDALDDEDITTGMRIGTLTEVARRHQAILVGKGTKEDGGLVKSVADIDSKIDKVLFAMKVVGLVLFVGVGAFIAAITWISKHVVF